MVRHHHLWCLFEHQHGFQWLIKPLTYLQGFQKLGKSNSSFWASWIGGNTLNLENWTISKIHPAACFTTVFSAEKNLSQDLIPKRWVMNKKEILPKHDPNISGKLRLFVFLKFDRFVFCVCWCLVCDPPGLFCSIWAGVPWITKVSDVRESQRPRSADSTLWRSLAWCIYVHGRFFF